MWHKRKGWQEEPATSDAGTESRRPVGSVEKLRARMTAVRPNSGAVHSKTRPPLATNQKRPSSSIPRTKTAKTTSVLYEKEFEYDADLWKSFDVARPEDSSTSDLQPKDTRLTPLPSLDVSAVKSNWAFTKPKEVWASVDYGKFRIPVKKDTVIKSKPIRPELLSASRPDLIYGALHKSGGAAVQSHAGHQVPTAVQRARASDQELVQQLKTHADRYMPLYPPPPEPPRLVS
eukprot:gene22571-27245_t